MSLDNEIIKTMLEIIKDISLNKEEIPPKVEEKVEEQGDEKNKEEQDNIKKAKMLVSVEKKSIHSNRWITHVKEFAKLHNISYNEALSKARLTYN